MAPLIKRILENVLYGELEAHLEEEPAEDRNRRNGKTSKTMKSEHGTFEFEAQRDCNSTFEPEIVKKRQTTLAPALEGKKHPVVIKSWNTNPERLSQYFKYPEDIRRIIYTTNIVEGFHRQIRKVTKTKGRSPATPPL